MQTVWVLFFLISTQVMAKPFERGIYIYPQSKFKLAEENQVSQQYDKKVKFDKLENIKYLIITGNLDYAKVLLKEADLSTDFTKAIQLRYLAMIYFIEGKYNLALDVLKRTEMQAFDAQSKVCFVRVLSHIILNRIEDAEKSWSTCEEATLSHSPTNLLWMRILVDLKTKKDPKYIENLFENISIDNIDQTRLRIYLKLALYLNKQEKLIPLFRLYSEEVLEDTILRELIGFNYFRAGNIQKAYALLENLNTANSEIFKGNIYSFQRRYNLAFAQYKLALNLKNNSQNAIDRLIPLSWKLEQYREGIEYLKKDPIKDSSQVERLTLMTAFLIMDNKFTTSKRYLEKILELTNKGEPVEVSQIASYTNLELKDYENLEIFAGSSCESYDGLNCWLLSLKHHWPEALENSHEDYDLHGDIEKNLTFLTSKVHNFPIKEVNPVDQRKIEELDNNLIQLAREETSN